MSGRVILAHLGDPWGYDRVKYMLAGEPSDVEVESTTSLAVLVELARREGREPRVLVGVQESLLAPPPPRKEKTRKREYNLIEPGIGNSEYSKLLHGLADATCRLLSDELGLACGGGDGGITVETLPSIGLYGVAGRAYKARWTIHKELLNRGIEPYGHYYSIALLKLLRTLLEEAARSAESGGKLEVDVDTTHGLNYAGLAFLRAALQASRMVAALYGVAVRFRQYNSEPYIKGVTKELRVYRVREEQITPRLAASNLINTLVSARSRHSKGAWRPVDAWRGALETAVDEYKKSIQRCLWDKIGWLVKDRNGVPGYVALMAAASTLFGAPLLLLQSGRWALEASGACGGPRACLDSLIEYVLSQADPNVSPNAVRVFHHKYNGEEEVVVEYLIAPSRRHLASLLAASAFAGYAARAYESLCGGGACAEPEPGAPQPVYGAVCAPLEVLERAREEYIVGPVWEIVENELSQFKRYLQAHGTGKDGGGQEYAKQGGRRESAYEAYARAAREGGCHASEGNCSVDRRVFQAHAGLASGTIGACGAEGRACLYYLGCSTQALQKASTKLLESLHEAIHKPS